MAGSFKITCAHGQKAYAYTTTASVAALNGATSWTIAFFYQFASWETGFSGDFVTIGGNPFIARASGANVQIFAQNAGNTKTIGKTFAADTVGHHFLISGNASGTSTIYIDGLANANTASLGALTASNIPCYFGWNDDTHAMTLYLRDIAVWGSYSASAADALALATGAKTPATLATPATNYWTLQGPAGAVTAGTQGLADAIGSVNLNGIFGAGVLTYDAHVITSTPVVAAFFMTPYVDTTGYLLFIPIYLNPAITGGGPLVFNSPTVSADPVFTVGGFTVVPTRLPIDFLSSFVAYQFTTPVTLGQAVTMAAAPGWALVTEGVVGGTSAAGLGSAPMTCLNYAGTARDSAVVTPTYKAAYNISGVGNSGNPGQPMMNWARRMVSLDPGIPGATNWHGTGSVTSFDANNLPASFTGGAGANLLGYVSAMAANNGADARGTPSLYGTLTLIHGDATAGVSAIAKVLQIDLVTLSAGWTVGSPTIVNAGVWDAGTSTWHKIIKTYPVTWSTSGGVLSPDILLQIARVDNVGGAVNIPILANGQSELGVFEPSVADPAAPATIPTNYLDLFDPLAVGPNFLARHAGAHAIRWMANQILMTNTGSGDLVYPTDLNIRKSTDFLATNSTTTTLDVTRVDPVSLSVPTAVICDYINGDASGTIPVALTPTRSSSGFALVTTSAPHGIRTGDRALIYPQPTTNRAAVIDSAYITLTGNIDAVQTTIPVSAYTNINGDSSCQIFNGQLLQIGSATTGEQVEVTGGDPTSTTITVNRGARGTTALAKTSGTVVYPCRDVTYGGLNDVIFAVSSTQLLTFLVTRAVPNNAPHSPTLLYAQTYSHGGCPVFVKTSPAFQGTSSYELCSRATSLVAAANPDGQCICWVSIPMFATDAAVTAIVNKMIPDFIATPGMDGAYQCSNEVFNGGFDQYVLAVTLGANAPNPQSGGTGFQDYWDYWASRQHHYNVLARAAFTAAGLDPDRVVWLQNCGNPGATQGAMAFCQRYSLPVRNLSVSFYADMSTSLAATYVSWLPASTGVTGATATWSLATARKVMMSNYRASIRYGQTGAIASNVSLAKYMSRYNNGISVDGVAPANTNPVRGRLAGYEGSCTQIIPSPNAAFPQQAAWTMAMQYDPEWYQTERAFYEANQDGSYQYALLMGSLFPDPTDAIMEFGCYFAAVNVMAPASPAQGYSYTIYRWQQQKAGYGDGSHGGVVNRLDFWDPTTPVSHDMTANGGILAPTINESVRGQVALDWIAASSSGGGRAALVMGI